MKRIKLTQNKYALVDDADFEWLDSFKWHADKSRNTWYVKHSKHVVGTKNKCKIIQMHRLIMKPKGSSVVDHIDGNGLNNQRKNLRVCTTIQNSWNKRKALNNTSGYRGISFRKSRQTWLVRIMKNGKEVFNKNFKTIEEAIIECNKALEKNHENYAKLI